MKIFQSGEKYQDFSKRSCCSGRPAQVKNTRFFKVVKNTEIFQSGEKCEDFSKWFHCNGQPTQMEDFGGGEKCEDFSKRFHCNGQPAKWKMKRVFKEV
jgi:hypothetical protein